MKMIQKFKFKAITDRGKTIHFTKEFDCPDFKTIPSKKLNGFDFPEVSIDSQLMDWLDQQDKIHLMAENNLACIIDYWIPKKKQSSKNEFIDFLKSLNLQEQMVLDLLAIYKEIKPMLKGKSIKSKIKILFSHYNVGIKATTNAYMEVNKMLESLNDDTPNDEANIYEHPHLLTQPDKS